MKLYILVSNGGDGSFSVDAALDPKVIDILRAANQRGALDYDSPGCDGDGFHYSTINVPDGSTFESLDIGEYSQLTLESVAKYIDEEDGEEEQ